MVASEKPRQRSGEPVGRPQQVGEEEHKESSLMQDIRRHNALYAAMGEGVCLQEVIYDKSGNAVDYEILSVNPSFETITGLDSETVVGRRASDIYGTGDPPYMDVYARVADSGEPDSFETYFPPMDKYFSISIFSPRLGQFTTVFSDITERKRAEKQLRQQGNVLEAINRVLLETLTCETREQVAQTCLNLAERLTDSQFGFIGEVNQQGSFDTIALSNPGWDSCRIPESNAVVMIRNMGLRGLWGKVINDDASLIANHPASHPDSVGTPEGHPPLLSFLGVPLRYAGNTVGMIALANRASGYGHDEKKAVETLSVAFVEALMRKQQDQELTEYRERLEELVEERTNRLRYANEQLQQANRTKSEFLTNMSHELRTPLNSIIGFAEVLQDGICGELNEDQLEFVADIHESGKHLLAMVNDILDLSKVEAGKLELQLESFQIAGLVDGILSSIRDMAHRKHLQLRMSIPEHLPDVRADQVKVKQIMYNLLSNAVKFTPEGGRITTSVAFDGNEFLVCVLDTGIGIEPEHHVTIFDAFEQVDSSQSRHYGGTGLGLALTRRLVELHGGRIWVESEGAGMGSRFSFILPHVRD